MLKRVVIVAAALLAVAVFFDLGLSLGATCATNQAPSASTGTEGQPKKYCSINKSATYGAAREFVHLVESGEHFLVALSTVVIAIFTIVLGIATAFLWKATRDLVKGGEESSKRELRAYPGIRGAFIWFNGSELLIQLKVFNHSPTPAYRFRYAIAAYSGPRVGRVWAVSMRPKRDAAVWDMTTNSDSTMRASCTIATLAEQTTIIRGGNRAVFIVGCITYRDIYGDHHFIKFRYRTVAFGFDKATGLWRCDEPEAFHYRSN